MSWARSFWVGGFFRDLWYISGIALTRFIGVSVISSWRIGFVIELLLVSLLQNDMMGYSFVELE